MGIVCPDESKRIEIEEFRRMLLSNAAVHRTKAGDEFRNHGQLPSAVQHNRELEEKKVCVTSGVSFLGIAIVNQLLLRGYSVRVIVEKQGAISSLSILSPSDWWRIAKVVWILTFFNWTLVTIRLVFTGTAWFPVQFPFSYWFNLILVFTIRVVVWFRGLECYIYSVHSLLGYV